ncbi:MAG TPA: sterol desaturase family protein [Kofleriaceae bacterium]|nr:sterol desaturase family protein [Kofleriaceae bacterium]
MSVIIAYSVPVFLALMVGEMFLRRAGARGYERRDTLASLAMGVGNVVVAALLKVVTFAFTVWLSRFALFDLSHGWWIWLLLVPAEDLCYYAFHRAHHEVRLLWAAHVNHHSSRHFNLSTALRQSWTTPITGPIFWAPLPLLGFAPLHILTAQAVSLVYQFWLHTEHIGRLGPLEWVFNTPSHHRVHHGRNVEYLDRNYAGIFIVWDRLFGTFEPERAPVDYGLTRNLSTFNPLRVAFHEFRAIARDVVRARSLKGRLAAALAPPGWSADGSTRTARQLQRELGGS